MHQTTSATDWAALRSLLLPSFGRINLNAGTLSPTPRPVIEAVERCRSLMHARPTEFFVELLPPLLVESRRRLAEYLNCDAAGLLLLPNVTFAMNIAIDSLPLKPGDEVLLTDHEYGALRLAWNRRARETGATLRIAQIPPNVSSPNEIIQRIEAQITDRTRILFFSHVTSPTGLILPAARLCALARRRGITSIVDGAHAPGMIPVDLGRIGADLYGANCHKWMMAAPGCGFLYAAAPVRPLLRPPVPSWGLEYDAARADEESGWGGSYWHKSFEYMGIFDRCPQCTVPAALDFRAEIGQANVDARVAELTRYARGRIEKAGLRCVSPEPRGRFADEAVEGGASEPPLPPGEGGCGAGRRSRVRGDPVDARMSAPPSPVTRSPSARFVTPSPGGRGGPEHAASVVEGGMPGRSPASRGGAADAERSSRGGAAEEALTGAMLIFDYQKVPEPTVTRTPWWQKRKILAPVTNIGERYFLRICCAWFNTEEEINALAEVIEEVGGQK